MSKSANSSDLSTYPISGRWTWNESGHHLEFLSNNLSSERQDRKRQQQKYDARSAGVGRSGDSGRQRSAATRQGIKQSPDHMFVTLQDVKDVAKCMLSEVESIAPAFDALYNTSQLDEYLLLLLNYFHWYFVKREKETNPNPIHIEQSLAEKRFLAELEVTLESSLKQLARSYGVLILGLGLCDEHHMTCGKSRTSNTYKDRGLYETMYAFCSFLVWIAFRRREYDVVKKEINRLMRSNTFNPALRAKATSTQRETSDVDGEKKEQVLTPAEYRRTLGHRPPIKDIINQRSEALVSILPRPKEEAAWLFKKSAKSSLNKSNGEVSAQVQLDEQNARQLGFAINDLQLGIIGEALDLFNPITLSTLDNDDDDKKQKTTSYRDAMEDTDPMRQTTAISEATTLAPSSN